MQPGTSAAIGLLVLAGVVGAAPSSVAQPQGAAAETFTATATVKTGAGSAATAPVTIVVTRKMTDAEADSLKAAFKADGPEGLRKALVGVPATGSIRLGDGPPTPTRLTLERTTGAGRLLTIVTDQPILFLGAGLPGAKPKTGYDFGVIDIEVDAQGSGGGTLAPAAKIKETQGAFVVADYGAELIRLAAVKKVK